jgi:PmbA protein
MTHPLASALDGCGAANWEVFLRRKRRLSLTIREGAVNRLVAADSAEAGVRVIVDGRPGFYYLTEVSDQGIRDGLAHAIDVATSSETDEAVRFITPAETLGAPTLELVDVALARMSVEERVERISAAESAALAAGAGEIAPPAVGYEESDIEDHLLNSNGVDLRQRRTLLTLTVHARASRGSEQRVAHDLACGYSWAEIPFAELGARTALKARAGLGASPIATQRCAAVLDRWVVAELCAALGQMISAEAVEQGSPFEDRTGERVFAEAVTLIDDGTCPLGSEASSFDGEGTPRQATTIVDRGVLTSLIYDRRVGARLSHGSTGNAAREEVSLPPQLKASNLYILPGEADRDRLLRELGDGLLITELLGAGMANPATGAFSGGAVGRRVRSGNLAEHVGGVVVTGNLIELLSSVRAVGNDLWFYGWQGGVSLLVEDLAVVG